LAKCSSIQISLFHPPQVISIYCISYVLYDIPHFLLSSVHLSTNTLYSVCFQTTVIYTFTTFCTYPF